MSRGLGIHALRGGDCILHFWCRATCTSACGEACSGSGSALLHAGFYGEAAVVFVLVCAVGNLVCGRDLSEALVGMRAVLRDVGATSVSSVVTHVLCLMACCVQGRAVWALAAVICCEMLCTASHHGCTKRPHAEARHRLFAQCHIFNVCGEKREPIGNSAEAGVMGRVGVSALHPRTS